ncbi:MAG: hypothetical protein MRJ96_08695 [Nitrospirales bacterium]|nr:hypothetical protein [Nitrospira sp.]MDR4501511.1 hypothetical protein [Nitrospirales bacterium]
MTSKKTHQCLQGLIAVLLVAFVGQVGYEYWFNKPKPTVFAAWAYDPRTMVEAKGLAQEVVEAEVTNVERADDLVVKAPGEPGGVERIAIEVVTMKVQGTLKGKPAQEVQVFRTAGIPVSNREMPPMSQAPPKPKGATNPPKRATPFNANTINIHDDVKYKKGERYMMFLRNGPTVKVKGRRVDTKSLVNPSTRFRIGKDNKISPIVQNRLGLQFKGEPLQEFKATIQKTGALKPIPGEKPGQMILPSLKVKPEMLKGLKGKIRPRGIDPGGASDAMQDMELGEVELPVEGAAPEYEDLQ